MPTTLGTTPARRHHDMGGLRPPQYIEVSTLRRRLSSSSARPVPNATGYLVYTLSDPAIGAGRERAFDAGRFVATNSLVVSDLEPRKVYGFRVAAVDANGVGLASQCVAVRFRGARHMQQRAAEALYVHFLVAVMGVVGLTCLFVYRESEQHQPA